MMLQREQELAVIKATVELRLKPFGPNKVFNLASLSAHLRNHASLQLSPEQLLAYFESVVDLSFLECLLAKRQRNFVVSGRGGARSSSAPLSNTTITGTGSINKTGREQTVPSKRKSDESTVLLLPDDDDYEETVESGQEDVSTRRLLSPRVHEEPVPKRRAATVHPTVTPQQYSSRTGTPTPRPSLRANRGNVNYKE
jgi:hypothetical protein